MIDKLSASSSPSSSSCHGRPLSDSASPGEEGGRVTLGGAVELQWSSETDWRLEGGGVGDASLPPGELGWGWVGSRVKGQGSGS